MQNGELKQVVGRWAGLACIAVVCGALLLQGIASAQGVIVTEDQAIADKFVRHTVTGITTPLPVLPDVTGFIGVSYLKVADLDGDGILEIIGTSGVGPDSNLGTNDGEVALFTWDGVNKGAWTKTVLNNTFVFPNQTIVRDMNDDGYLDIVVFDKFIGNPSPSGIYYLEHQGGDIADAANWIKRTVYQNTGTKRGYKLGYFIDVDGDGDDDIITTDWGQWIGWLENTGSLPYTPHTIGTGGGALFTMFDVDADGHLDLVVPQFSITTGMFSNEVKGGPGGSDPLGDSLVWFKNPGTAAMAANKDLAWSRYTIDNWYTSVNPIGKAMEVVIADINADGISELVVSNHSHQDADDAGLRIWPSGLYYFTVPGLNGNPGNPGNSADWEPITIETGDPDFEYFDPMNWPYEDPNVLADVYATDRRGSFYDQGAPGMVRASDVNGDGLVDLVVPGDGKGRLYYYEAGESVDGDLTFTRATLYSDPQCMPGEALVVDLDGDGDLDIVAAIFDTSVTKPYPYTSGSIFFFEQITDNPPALGDGPFLAAGPWPLLPAEAESPMYLDANYDVLWTFSDDFASCSEDCTHAAEYQAVGADTWTSLDVTANAAKGTARVTLPVESLQNATTYALRFSVTDCASQTTESNTYYFRVAVTDAPPVITGGPFLAAGPWPLLPASAAQAMVLDQNYDVLWTFSDDYAYCSGLCTHRARYRRIVDDGSWIWEWLPVTTDATGKKRARVTLPIESMEPGEYMFYFDVRDCAGQRTSAPKVYYFKVEADN